MQRRQLLPWAAALNACALASTAWAQVWPDKPIRLVVAFALGDPADIAARLDAKDAADGYTQLAATHPGAGH